METDFFPSVLFLLVVRKLRSSKVSRGEYSLVFVKKLSLLLHRIKTETIIIFLISDIFITR